MFNYDNIGEKIKGLAKAFFFIGAIAAVFAGIFLMSDSEDTVLWGLLMIIAGPIISWVSSWLLYGFGQLIENSDMQVTLLRKMERQLSTLREESAPDAKPAAATVTQAAFVPKAPRENRWKCNECGYDYNVEGKTSCDICGSRR